jgi:hypothetical protein
MAVLNDFIQIHENAINLDTCEFLVELFEQNPEYRESEDNLNYSQFNLTDVKGLSEEVNKVHNELIQNVFKYRDEYYDTFDKRVFPKTHAFEKFKIQRFMPDEEEDDTETYVDVQDYTSARRFLCFMWYLNDNEAGQDEFLDLFIQPEKGKLVIYPSLWLFPHKKIAPVKESQYILRTYLHYK